MKRVIVIAAFLLAVSNAFGTELWVPSQYSTIQSAIDAASDGDTIIVQPGTYDGNLQWDVNNLTLTSVNPKDPCVINATVIEGGNIIVQFDPAVNGGLLTGFTIGGEYYGSGSCGVLGNNVTTATISHCIIRNMSNGVVAWSGAISHCIIRDNTNGVIAGSV